MAYIDLYPTSKEAEEKMLAGISALQQIIRICVKRVWEIPPQDIIVMAHKNTVLVQDPFAKMAGVIPEIVIKIHTSDKNLQERAEALQQFIVGAWRTSFGTTYPMEVWVIFFEAWGCTIDFGEKTAQGEN